MEMFRSAWNWRNGFLGVRKFSLGHHGRELTHGWFTNSFTGEKK